MKSYYRDYRIHNELLTLRKQVEDFKSGKAYAKIKEEYQKKLTEKLRQIDNASKRIRSLEENCRLLKSEKTILRQNCFFLKAMFQGLKASCRKGYPH